MEAEQRELDGATVLADQLLADGDSRGELLALEVAAARSSEASVAPATKILKSRVSRVSQASNSTQN